jgi:hypothetical protein
MQTLSQTLSQQPVVSKKADTNISRYIKLAEL